LIPVVASPVERSVPAPTPALSYAFRVSAGPRVAFASGVGGLVGATLLLAGRFDAPAVVALLFVGAASVAVPACLLESEASAAPALARQAWFAPSWALIVAAGVFRAGSPALSDARGANAVAGLAITHGHAIAVVGAWLAIAAGVVAIAGRTRLDAAPPTLQRLEIGATLAQAGLLVTLFAGPPISSGLDAVPWVVGIAAAVSLEPRRFPVPNAPLTAFALAGVGFAAMIAGGAP
jgi:hypothetical protein